MTDTTDRKSLVNSALFILIGQGFRFAISFSSQIILARLLLPTDFGLVAMISPITGFLALFGDFGLMQAVIQRPTMPAPLLNAVFWITMAISLGLGVLFAALTPLIVLFYGDPRLYAIGFFSSIFFLVSGLGSLPGALLYRQLRIVTVTIIEVVTVFAGLVVAIAAARAGWGYWALILSPSVTTTLNSIAMIAVVRWRPSWPTREAEKEAIAMLRFGGQLTGSRIVGSLNSSADNMMIGGVLGSSALGIYDRGWRLTMLTLGQLSAPVSRLALPVLSRVQEEPARYCRVFGQMLPLMSLVVMPGLIYGIVAADRWIPTLLGPHWLAAIPVFRWVCAGALVVPFNSAAGWLMVSQHRTADNLRYNTIAAVINIASYALGLIWGIVGVARTATISLYFFQVPLIVWAATRKGPVDLPAFLKAAFPLPLVVLVDALPLYLLTHWLSAGSFLSIAIGGSTAYALAGAVLATFPTGRRTLATVWDAVPERITRLVIRPRKPVAVQEALGPLDNLP